MPFILPGSQKARNRATHILKAQDIRPDLWLITGGEQPHEVRLNKTETGYEYDCDCGNGKPFCSHEIRVMMEVEPGRLEYTHPQKKTKRPRNKPAENKSTSNPYADIDISDIIDIL